MWTATITEEAWKKMGSWSLSETPLHRSPHTREAPAEPHVLYDAAAGIGTPFWNSTPFDPVMWLQNVPREASARAARRGAGAKAAGAAVPPASRRASPTTPRRRGATTTSFKFIKEFVLARSALLKVLDVGGGDGQARAASRRRPPRRLSGEALTSPAPESASTDRNLPAAANSTDLVLFNYVLHHAADDTPLLKEARRVVKPDGRVVVVEDLRADDAAGLRHQDSEHKGCPRRCVFRTDNEWRAIFRRLGLRVESTAAPPRDCIPHYQVDRALYVIT